MRKLTPAAVRADFADAVKAVRDSFDEVAQSGVSQATKKLVAEQALLAAAVLWEGFLSDLVVAFVNRKPTKFVAHIEAQVSITSKDPLAKRALHILAPKAVKAHLNVEEVRGILDDKERNLTFDEVAKMKETAGKLLEPTDAAGFLALEAADEAAVAASNALRNFLAHRSASSRTTLQDALASASLQADLRRGPNKVYDVGAYLLATPPAGAPVRLHRYLAMIDALAAKVCP
jgi:hypothetical protein